MSGAEDVGDEVADTGSVTQWLLKLRSGDHEAAARLWSMYYSRLVQFAERRMGGNSDHATDSEDLVHSAFRHFCLAAMSGRYGDLSGRRELWDLLITCTLNRIRNHLRAQRAVKRQARGDRVRYEDAELVLADLRRPEAGVVMADLLNHWLEQLDQEDPSGELRQVAVWRMEQRSADWIARALRRSKTVVLSQIRVIGLVWERCEEL
jgi:DNA-directed RNA polymerase specialized sigma24 family protein